MKNNDNTLVDYTKIVVETDEVSPITIATITCDDINPADGYRVRMTPKYDEAEDHVYSNSNAHKIAIAVDIDDIPMDRMLEKVRQLIDLLKEAKALADDLTSGDMKVDLEINP